ncbi:hypothetical protein F5B19DRAFT_480747 [Rostrohypoxylon terebratum]|nr:hypothetical protein F5B19DRAFT_480747 [Rostrohypoxylon terebratum]
MTEGEAIQLLFTLLNTPDNEANRVAAAGIVRRLGFLPLAIDQAGAYMTSEGIALGDFLGCYEQSAKDVLESVPNLWEYYGSNASESEQGAASFTAKTVFTTWNLSFTLLKPDTPEGALKATVLYLLAFFNEKMISEELFAVHYSANQPSQQPEWISLFIDEEGSWSSRKFDVVMRTLSQLSLITSLNTDRVDTKYAFISLHPLVRDWINLRQEKDIYNVNFEKFTRILASNLATTFLEDSFSEIDFRMSTDQMRQLTEHMAHWMNVFRLRKSNLRPTFICAEDGPDVANINTAERLIAKFCCYIRQREDAYEISQWLWESCDIISDRHMMRVKFDAGRTQVHCLLGTDAARDESRKLLQYWESVLEADHLRDDMLLESRLLLTISLIRTVHVDDKEECIKICEAELERLPNNEENISLRHRILTKLAYAANLSYRRNLCERIVRIMLDETERGGSNKYRKKIWRSEVWYFTLLSVINYDLEGSDLANLLSLAALEWAEENLGINSIYTKGFNLARATVLLRMGKLDEAETITQACITNGHVNRDINACSQLILGNILWKHGRFEEAYTAYNSGLLQTQHPRMQKPKLLLLESCGQSATAFNLELADAHFTMLLSLIKEVKDWNYMVLVIIKSYGVKESIGTEVNRQDALELLVDGLTLYGIEFDCEHGDTKRTPLREIQNTIRLGELEPSQHLAQDEAVRKALMVKYRGSYVYGVALLLLLAVHLLKDMDVNAAEHAFRLARYAFDNATKLDEGEIVWITEYVFRYTELRYAIDKNKGKVRDILYQAQIDIPKKIPRIVEDYADWWELRTTPLLDIIENPAQRVKRKFSKAKKRIHGCLPT